MSRILTSADDLFSWVKKEINISAPVKQGSIRSGVRRIQEWLNLHGYRVSIDGGYGPITTRVVEQFQDDNGIAVSGVVDKSSLNALIAPLLNVLKPIDPGGHTLSTLTMAYAEQHLEAHPLEVGGNNKGPWVRLYTKGNEGEDWPWCAHFVTFVLQQAAETLNLTAPIRGSGSCDSLAAQAKEAGLFANESTMRRNLNEGSDIPHAAIFLVRRTSTDWTHTGFVTNFEDSLFSTIEGNTNDDGNRDGYEVCERTRGYSKKDFILI